MEPKDNVSVLNTKTFLTHAMAKLDEETVFCLVRQGLEKGMNSFVLLEQARAGMQKVGEMYQSGKYFLGDLIVAAEIFQEVLALILEPGIETTASKFPPVIFGTVEEDIHDIGKNITIGVLKSKGIEVIDLGVDVPPEAFANAVRESKSPLICLSGLITSAYDSMKRTVALLEKEGLRPGVTVIIGGLVNDAVKKYTGADFCFSDCAAGSAVCETILRNQKRRDIISL